MNSNIPYPGPAFRPATAFPVKSELARLTTSDNSVACQWWRAFPNPAFDESTGTSDNLAVGRFLLVKQTGTFNVVVSGARMVQKYFPQGTWVGSEIMLAFDSLTFPLSVYDQIILGSSTADGRRFTQKQTVNRGSQVLQLTGTLATSGTAVTGTGTTFTTQAAVGQVLMINGESQLITAIADDTHLTVGQAYTASYANMDASVGYELLLYWPAVELLSCASVSHTYVIGTEVALSADGMSLVWLNPATAPAPGVRVALMYDYMPRYQITEYGIKGQVVDGAPTLDAIAAQLWKPQLNANA